NAGDHLLSRTDLRNDDAVADPASGTGSHRDADPLRSAGGGLRGGGSIRVEAEHLEPAGDRPDQRNQRRDPWNPDQPGAAVLPSQTCAGGVSGLNHRSPGLLRTARGFFLWEGAMGIFLGHAILCLTLNEMNRAAHCAAIIPCLNEAKTSQRVVAAVRAHVPRVYVVDDGSTDASAALGAEAGAVV